MPWEEGSRAWGPTSVVVQPASSQVAFRPCTGSAAPPTARSLSAAGSMARGGSTQENLGPSQDPWDLTGW